MSAVADGVALRSAPRHHGRDLGIEAMLTAADDPIVALESFRSFPFPACLHLHVEAHGGHVGYLERHGLGARAWLPDALLHHVETLAGLTRLNSSHSLA